MQSEGRRDMHTVERTRKVKMWIFRSRDVRKIGEEMKARGKRAFRCKMGTRAKLPSRRTWTDSQAGLRRLSPGYDHVELPLLSHQRQPFHIDTLLKNIFLDTIRAFCDHCDYMKMQKCVFKCNCFGKGIAVLPFSILP